MNAIVDINKLEKVAEEMCDGFCYFRVTYTSQEVIDLYCEECPVAKLLKECRENPIGRNGWQE